MLYFVLFLLFNFFLFVMRVFCFNKTTGRRTTDFASNYGIYNQTLTLMILFFSFNYLIFNGKKI
ncbi:hypothetical protein PEC301879_29720 [Pectobacterium carotovorum subsp. carotovorum]|nr:hypothetical protein PEC301879_29720 [Pectobacterium carotovorum subsp. carotovorum]